MVRTFTLHNKQHPIISIIRCNPLTKTTTQRSLLYIFCVQVRLTKHVEKLILFMEVHREIEKWLEGMSETIGGLLPISEDSDEAKAQLANTKVTLSGLRKVSPNDPYLKLSDTSFAGAFLQSTLNPSQSLFLLSGS